MRTISRTVQPLTFENLGNILRVFTFGIRERSKEHRADIESEDPQRDTAVIDILGREG